MASIVAGRAVYPPGHPKAGQRMNMAGRRSKVHKWESWLNAPEPVAQYALADELDVPYEVVDANPWPGWLLTVDREEPVDALWTAGVAGQVLDSVVSSALMDRRTFFGATAGTLVAMAEAWAGASTTSTAGRGRGVVTLEAVTSLQNRVSELWRLDDLLGGGGCLETGVADLRLVTTLLQTRRYDEEVGKHLLSLAGALARFCGWAAFDDGRIAAAERYWHAALRATAAARRSEDDPYDLGDGGQGIYTLSNLALAAVYVGDGATSLQLLDQARAHVDPAQKVVLSMLECWASRAHALVGDKAAAAAAVNHADNLWEDRRAGDDPAWVYWMPRPSLTAEASTALMHIGDYDAAERNLTDGLKGAADAGPRDRTLYLAQLAETHRRAGRQDQAVATTHQALEMGAGVDSARVRGRVDAVIELIPLQERARAELVDHRHAAWAA